MEEPRKSGFERAASLRDKIVILKRWPSGRRPDPDLNDKDLFAAAMGEREATVQAFLSGRESCLRLSGSL